jgi:hypothetical protein
LCFTTLPPARTQIKLWLTGAAGDPRLEPR